MSDGDKNVSEIHDEDDVNYKPPPEKTLKEIVEADQNDASLQKYKEALLGQAIKEPVVVEPDNPNRVLVKRLALVVEGRPDVVLDLTDDLENLKKKTFAVKEGIQYRIRIDFYVQREIVTGLKYIQKVIRHGIQQGIQYRIRKTFAVKEGIQYRIRIDFYVQREIVTGLKYIQKVIRHGIQHEKLTHMVGSYAPKLEMQSYSTPVDEMPSGFVARGTYTVKSLFTDDDKNEHLKWEWCFELKKDWE